ncbi:hypothetical protein [Aquabacterium sp.]|uniref:hypothetical protein n=1 Tax=Aquabacterium sp. TaxID=1872578 RepID=UPI0025C4A671|nr:hypothetical protein [Aquabacterium sp.]
MSNAELQHLRDDFLYYAPRALHIKTKSGAIVPFVLNSAQVYIHHCLEAQRQATGKVRANILKGRQQGCSTLIQGRFYHRCSMRPGVLALILTHLADSTTALFSMTKRFHDLCPDEIRPSTGTANENELTFDRIDSGYVVATAGNRKGVGRGRTFQLFHGSESAYWDNAQEHMAALGQTVPDLPGTEIIKESTANGVGNQFHQDWMAAQRGETDYVNVFVPWYWQQEYRRPVTPGFQLDNEEQDYLQRYEGRGLTIEHMVWRRAKLQSDLRGDVGLFDQEYPAEPLLAFSKVSGDPLISAALVSRAQRPALNVEARGPRIMGVDPAEYGDDATAIALRQGRRVFGLDRDQKIMRLYKHGPMEVVGKVAIQADKHKPDAINVDCTGIGSGVADRLTELGYPVNRILFGGRPNRDELYVLKRDEIWGDMLEWLEDEPCQLPIDDGLATDLCGPQKGYDSSRRLRLESKEQMRKRGVSSPDSGDAVALTFATPFASYAGAKSGSGSYRASRGRRPMR